MAKTDMPTSRSYLSSSTVDEKIYAIGGLHGSTSVATVEEYDPSSDLGPRLGGAWIVAAPTPLGGKVVHTVFMTAQDVDGLRYTVVMAHSECTPTVWGTFPEATKKADMVGMAVKTGPITAKGTLMGYGVKEGELEEELLYIQVASFEGTLVDENTLELTATQSFFLPDQDADGDGFPDAAIVFTGVDGKKILFKLKGCEHPPAALFVWKSSIETVHNSGFVGYIYKCQPRPLPLIIGYFNRLFQISSWFSVPFVVNPKPCSFVVN
jgi:hypothetical protein